MTGQRVFCLPVRRCDDCGDDMVSAWRDPICRPCIRLALLRQRLARQPGAQAIRRSNQA